MNPMEKLLGFVHGQRLIHYTHEVKAGRHELGLFFAPESMPTLANILITPETSQAGLQAEYGRQLKALILKHLHGNAFGVHNRLVETYLPEFIGLGFKSAEKTRGKFDVTIGLKPASGDISKAAQEPPLVSFESRSEPGHAFLESFVKALAGRGMRGISPKESYETIMAPFRRPIDHS